MQIITIIVGYLETNCYLLVSPNKDTLIIDPGAEASKILSVIDQNQLKPVMMVLTHLHPDHVEASLTIKEKWPIPLCYSRDEEQLIKMAPRFWQSISAPMADRFIKENDVLSFGEEAIKVIATPGHSAGGLSFYDGNGHLFSGDTLFNSGIGRWDLPTGSKEALGDSINKKLFALPDAVIVYPGHGPTTTIAAEKKRRGKLFE